MRHLSIAIWTLALGVMLAPAADAQPAPCKSRDGTSLRDKFWRREPSHHPLVGQVLKAGKPIGADHAACAGSPLRQLIVEIWDVMRGGGIVLLGETHDNVEHHRVRGDILWPRLEPQLQTRALRPAAVFEHIRTSQQRELDRFYDQASRSRRLWRAPDLLRELGWESSGWPPGKIFEPLFDAALWARLPILPGTPPGARTRALVRGDEAGPSEEEQARLEVARAMPAPLLHALAVDLEASHCGVVPSSALGAMSLAQRYVDAHLAGRAVAAAEQHAGAFVLAGNGHVRTDRGVPWYLRRMAPGRRVAAVMLLEVETGKLDGPAYVPRGPDGAWAADYALFTPPQVRADPCEAMRRRRP